MMSIAEGKLSEMANSLTLLLVTQELLLEGAFGPLSARQHAILSELVSRSERLGTMFREACTVKDIRLLGSGTGRPA